MSNNTSVHLYILITKVWGSVWAEAVESICGIKEDFLEKVKEGFERRLSVWLSGEVEEGNSRQR